MAGIAGRKDIGVFLKQAAALTNAAITAGAGNDGSAVNGLGIDRATLAGGDLPLSIVVLVGFTAVLGQDETLSYIVKLQDSADGSTWADLTDENGNVITSGTAQVAATGGGGGSTENGVFTLKSLIQNARQHVRAVVTADLSRANTDTVTHGAVAVFGGFAELPA